MNRRQSIAKRYSSLARLTHGTGFTLLEVLIAVLVLSVGLLGLASLQAFGLKNNHSALLRSQAVVLVNDAMDRMRGNREQALLGVNSLYNTSFTDTPVAANCTTCTSSQLASIDLAAWKSNVSRLPGGKGQISISAAGKATVQVRWADSRRSEDLLTFTVESFM